MRPTGNEEGFRSIFGEVFDVAVIGTGYAGYAAAEQAARSGQRVLLVGDRGDLLWESGRGHYPHAGSSDHAGWQELTRAVEARGGRREDWLDGAIAEVVATDRLMATDVSVLYYARVIGVEERQGLVLSVIVATRVGRRRLNARQWIDATETGELIGRFGAGSPARPATSAIVTLHLQHPDWSDAPRVESLRPTSWPTERLLTIEVPVADRPWRHHVLGALATLEQQLGKTTGRVSMSHLSIDPVRRYAGPGAVFASGNVASASPSHSPAEIRALSARYELGIEALDRLHDLALAEPADPDAPLPSIDIVEECIVDVCVAGGGTGGAIAALAAARAGAEVLCLDALPFLGGIGTGGGIHGYWFGIAGGLQQELDRRTRTLMRSHHGGPLGDGPFNPWAKMIALETWAAEEGVDVHPDSLLFEVERQGTTVVAVLVATSRGVLRIAAHSFIDGTGDGDLCALAGAEFVLGRELDGMLHAYSQSSGRLTDVRGRPRMDVINFDAGFCDPCDPEDLTRARMAGVRQYLVDAFDNLGRPTYIAPALGLRQGRHIVTDHTLTLDDLISRRTVSDPIGFIGSHYDNHASDAEFATDEEIFWMWLNRQHGLPLSCELSYRSILPRGLDNVWIASRCLGVAQDAQCIARMQRDMQRAGEAAGIAAGAAAAARVSSREIPYATIAAGLDGTGALERRARTLLVGAYPFGGDPVLLDTELPTVDRAVATLERGEPGEALWWLSRHPEVGTARLQRALSSDDPMVSWLAAGVAAMWGEESAEPRLLRAIETLEYGFGDGYEWTLARNGPQPDDPDPENWNVVVPNWLCAVALLRKCGTAAALPALERLAAHPVHGVNTVTTLALTLERLTLRGRIAGPSDRDSALRILDSIAAAEVVGTFDRPARPIGKISDHAIRTELDATDPHWANVPPTFAQQLHNAFEDNSWQLELALARARVALGLGSQPGLSTLASDPRSLVRRAHRSITT